MQGSDYPTFMARVVSGRKRGRTIGFPTLNLDLGHIPPELGYGIYACFVRLGKDRRKYPAVAHYGPRPVFNDTASFEVHVIDRVVEPTPNALTVSVVEHIRDITDFPLREVMQEQIQSDIRVALGLLGVPPKQS